MLLKVANVAEVALKKEIRNDAILDTQYKNISKILWTVDRRLWTN
jgi:hypothetical protein